MVEILIKASDVTHSDPTVDARDCFKRGDPIDIRPAGYPWGHLEGNPTVSYVVVITDATMEQVARYLEPQYDPLVRDPETDQYAVLRVRRWYAHGTPLAWQSELAATGRITKTWAEVAPYVWDKSTGKNEEGRVL